MEPVFTPEIELRHRAQHRYIIEHGYRANIGADIEQTWSRHRSKAVVEKKNIDYCVSCGNNLQDLQQNLMSLVMISVCHGVLARPAV